MYLPWEGRIRLEELKDDTGPFSRQGKRMATTVCTENCRLQSVTRNKVRELIFQNPRLSVHMIDVVMSRLAKDLKFNDERATVESR